jgi:hypothetical protein
VLTLSLSLSPSLQAIFLRAAHFGGGVFSLAASVMRVVIHHDPTCFPQVRFCRYRFSATGDLGYRGAEA